MDEQITRLQEERQFLEELLEQTMKEMREAQAFYHRHGDLSQVWREKFDERFRISRQIHLLDEAIRGLTHKQNAAYKVA